MPDPAYDQPVDRSGPGATALVLESEEDILDRAEAVDRSTPDEEDRAADGSELPWTDEELARERAGLERILERVERNGDELRAMVDAGRGIYAEAEECSRHGFVHRSGHCWDDRSLRAQ